MSRALSMGDVVIAAMRLVEPSAEVDGMVDLAARAAASGGGLAEAMFGTWAIARAPAYTESVEAVRELGAKWGIPTRSKELTYGFEGTAVWSGGDEAAFGFNAATAEVAALLMALRKRMSVREEITA